MNIDMATNFTFLNTWGIFSYLTFANGGYIIKINPIAKGMLVVPLDIELMNEAVEGIKYPIATPITMAEKIHTVKYLSKKLNLFLFAAGAQFVFDI